MTQMLATRLSALVIALGATSGAALLVAAAYAGTSTASRRPAPKGALVAIRKTTLGAILVDARGRTLYLFEKDRSGMSACETTCAKFWPALSSGATPRAGRGVHRFMLQLTKQHNGVQQVMYAGHPLYTFVGDKRPGQTTGEGLDNFGAGWYALAANGQKVEQSKSSAGGYRSGGGR